MQKANAAGRAVPLVLEVASGTAIVDGEEIELPLREFKLLAALARRVGEPVASAELTQAVWPEDHKWTSKEDLYVLVSKLRRLIDGPTKFGSNIRNRRGFGYVLELDAAQVKVVEPLDDEETADLVVSLKSRDDPDPQTPEADEAPDTETLVHDEGVRAPVAEAATPKRPRRWIRVAGVLALVIALLGASWSAGYLLSKEDQSQQEEFHQDAPAEVEAPTGPSERKEAKLEKGDNQGNKAKKPKDAEHKQDRNQDSVVIGAPAPTTGGSDSNLTNPSEPQGDPQGSSKGSKKEQKPAPTLPPAPTRFLYHLVNEETGNHFVTTDGNTASEYEAKGYVGGVVARVYTSSEEGTKAISTNHGTAYIFSNSSPKTEPATQAQALWYSTNDKGDFFYTTNEAEAKQSGWQGSVIGYVRAP